MHEDVLGTWTTVPAKVNATSKSGLQKSEGEHIAEVVTLLAV
jgi:hypothetical protein